MTRTTRRLTTTAFITTLLVFGAPVGAQSEERPSRDREAVAVTDLLFELVRPLLGWWTGIEPTLSEGPANGAGLEAAYREALPTMDPNGNQ
jgi:hypothetical protein